jgi:hypothetical protein
MMSAEPRPRRFHPREIDQMPDERTYGEEEVAEIFRVAAETRGATGGTALEPVTGFTLAELQSIGGEVGLAPERVAQAAAAVDLRRGAVRRRELGMPVSVGRVVDLPRAPTDLEWEMLVADLRDTFGAKGRVGSRGEVREWNNGNLQAFVEPTPNGHRLRLKTTKGNAIALNRMGAAGLAVALVTLMLLLLTGALPQEMLGPLVLSLMGGGALAANALSLPGWAQRRESQMEAIAVRARTLLGAPPAPQLAWSAGDPPRIAG